VYLQVLLSPRNYIRDGETEKTAAMKGVCKEGNRFIPENNEFIFKLSDGLEL
jgi:hypothetical protein